MIIIADTRDICRQCGYGYCTAKYIVDCEIFAAKTFCAKLDTPNYAKLALRHHVVMLVRYFVARL